MRQFLPANLAHRPAPLQYQRRSSPPRVPWYSSGGRNPSCLCFLEIMRIRHCRKIRPPSKLPLRDPHSNDPYKCQKPLYSCLPWINLLFLDSYCSGLTSSWLVTLSAPATSAALASTALFSSTDR